MIIVSNFTQTLDMLQRCCTRQGYPVIRLDGRTRQDERMRLINRFNTPDDTDEEPFVFLLSAKSGGVGLNLIGANRLVLFDSDWNPSTDQQAMARIHRDGQLKPCFIYRMLLAGSIDEKIYQRQLTKMGLSDTLIGEGSSGDSFSQEDLRDIFTLSDDTKSITHELLGCMCDGSGTEHKAADVNDDDGEDPTPTGFVSAREHSRATMRQQSRQLAAQLGNQRHYDILSYPAKFAEDDMLRFVASRQQQHRAEALEKADEDGDPDAADEERLRAEMEAVVGRARTAGAQLVHGACDLHKLARECAGALRESPGELTYVFAYSRNSEDKGDEPEEDAGHGDTDGDSDAQE